MSSSQDEWESLFQWVESVVGGRIVWKERQPRWRPAWYFDVEVNGKSVPLYWRGGRVEAGANTALLEREMRVIEVLERHGIPVAHPYGLCQHPPGLLLERRPGRPNLATAEGEAERVAVLDHYVEVMARAHAIDIDEFEAIGLRRPPDAERSCLGELPAYERLYRQNKRQPDPMIEFQIRWVRRNVPRDRSRVTFLLGDSGQFLFDKGRVTAVIDLEMAYLGDPAADLAGLFGRDLSEPLGDLQRAMLKYAEFSGSEVDPHAIDYHTVRFGLVNPLSMAHHCADPAPTVNYVQYLAWYVVYARAPLEVLARMVGAELAPPPLPEPAPSRRSPAYGLMVSALDPKRAGDDAERAYELDRLYRVAQYLDSCDRYGPALDSDDLDDVADILGHRPRNWREADEELERFVLDAGPEHDAELVRYFHRRLLREEALLRPALRELQNVRLQAVS